MNEPRNENSKVEGELQKDEAFANLEATREWVLLLARRVFATVLLQKGTATIDDVRAVVAIPDGMNPVCMGPVPVPFARQNWIERVGFARTTRTEGHARPVSTWECRSPSAIGQWLIDNPHRPPPDGAIKSQQSLWSLNETSPLGNPTGPVIDSQI